MPTIDVSEDQREYLEDLRRELEERHVGDYGTVRHRDALQFLIDRYEEGSGTVEETDAGEREEGNGDDSDTDGTTRDDADVDEEGGPEDDEGADEGEDDGGGRLQTMMQLLDDHEDKWEAVDSEEGKYAVTLPDGDTEHVRTKDDVRALLFQHYA